MNEVTQINFKRAQRALGSLERTISNNQDIADRTAAAFAGALPMVEAEMTEKQVAIRLPEDWLKRIEELIPKVGANPEYEAFGKAKRSTVLRLAIAKGLKELEAEYGQELDNLRDDQ